MVDSVEDIIRNDPDYIRFVERALTNTTDAAITKQSELIDLCWFIENGHSLAEIKAYAREVLRQLGEV